MMNSCLKLLIRIYYFSPNNGPSTLTVSYKPKISLLFFFIDMQNASWWQMANNPSLQHQTLQKKALSLLLFL